MSSSRIVEIASRCDRCCSKLDALDSTHTSSRLGYEQTRHVAAPQVVLIDVAYQQFLGASELASGIRAVWEYVPIVLMAHRDELERIPYGIDVHGFLTLPIILPELEARLRFAQWKTQGILPNRDLLVVDELVINLATYEVSVDGRPLALTYKEFALLKFFASHPRRIFSRAELLDTVWEGEYDGGTRTVDVHVRRLREKLGQSTGNRITTVRNIGYRFG